MNNKKLVETINKISSRKDSNLLGDWDEFIFGEKKYYLINLTEKMYKKFNTTKDGIPVIVFQQRLSIESDTLAQNLFDSITGNESSIYMFYKDFHNFLLKASKDLFLDMLNYTNVLKEIEDNLDVIEDKRITINTNLFYQEPEPEPEPNNIEPLPHESI